MKHSLLLIFEDILFEIYDAENLRYYFEYLKNKVYNFNKELNLNFFIAVNPTKTNIVQNFFDKATFIHYDKSIKSLFESFNSIVKDLNINSEENFTLILSSSYPFFSFSKNKFILEDSEKYLVDYYYGENFPEGIVGQVIKNSIIEEVIRLADEKDSYHHNFIFDILLRNISLFDVDLIEGFDYYLPYRISLSLSDYTSLPLINLIYDNNVESVNNKNVDFVLNEKYIQNIGNLTFFNQDIKNIYFEWEQIENILRKLENLYTIPKTYIIELSSKCNFNCIHCPNSTGLKREKDFLDKDDLFDFINKNEKYFEDVNFIIGGFGEPFLHKDFIEIVKILSKNNKVFIETNGSFLTSDFFKNFDNIKNIFLIISIDAIKEETYKSLGKKMILSLLLKIATELLENYPDNVYISYLRMTKNDDEVESFYNHFQKFEKNIIFRKYNSYSKRLENLEIADLTPVERFACYHIRREFFILSDGRLALCYSDYNGEKINLTIKDNFELLLNKYKEHYFEHCNKKYNELCSNCNEFYTFFF